MAALLVLGAFSYSRLSVEQFPDVSFPVVVVQTDYPGASPENVEGLLKVGFGKDWERYFVANGCGDIVPAKKPNAKPLRTKKPKPNSRSSWPPSRWSCPGLMRRPSRH